MFENLRADIAKAKDVDFVAEAASKKLGGDDDIRDMFLDDKEAIIIGSEDDPEIKKLVEDLPEDGDDDIDYEDVAENAIPETEFVK